MKEQHMEVLFGALLVLGALMLGLIVFFESESVSAWVAPESGGVVEPTVRPLSDPA
jgi:hypothetical protein